MIHKYIIRNISKLLDSRIYIKRHSSLFINGPKATENFVYVIPHIDFPERLKQREILQQSLKRRNTGIDLKKIENLWSVYDELKTKKANYDKKKEEISWELGKLMKNEPDSDATKQLRIQMELIKDNIKKLKAPLWSAEEAAVIEALSLPNHLDSRTPDGETKILYTHLSAPKINKDHLTIGREMNLIDFKKNENYYLKGDAAIFELGAKFYFSSLLKQHRFVQFSNPDFVKSVIIEGCGSNHMSSDYTFILHHDEDSKVNVDNRLHLTGGASLYSYLAYHTKNVLYAKVLPLKYFTMGRQYVPSPSEEDSLFHVSQSSVIECFSAAKTENELNTMLDDLMNLLKAAYTNLGYHFRMCIVPADRLLMQESLRVTVEMYSTSLESYVEVASLSLSGNFISKRLQFTYVENKQNNFPHLLHGTLLNVPKLLGCVLEQDNDFLLPDMFKVHNWSV